MDINNPAVAEKTLLSPRDVAEIQDDPAKLERVARAMGAVNLENLYKRMQHPDTNPAVRIDFQKLLNRMGRLEPDIKDQSGSGPQVIINITRAKDNSEGLTIEGTTIDAI